MDQQDLEAQAARIRGIFADWEIHGALGVNRMRSLIRDVEGLARALLERGSATTELKAEIIDWVVRVRAEQEALNAASVAHGKSKRAQASDGRLPDAGSAGAKLRKQHSVPVRTFPQTKTFTYDTTDSRTANPGFVKRARIIPAAQRTVSVPKPAPLGTTRSALLFTKKLDQLREEVRRTGRRPRGAADAVLKARILALYQGRTASLASEHHGPVGLELEELARTLGTSISSYKASPGNTGYVPVPHELTFSKGGPVVSGGLPTLGRGHR